MLPAGPQVGQEAAENHQTYGLFALCQHALEYKRGGGGLPAAFTIRWMKGFAFEAGI